jgi:hypothetical protein
MREAGAIAALPINNVHEEIGTGGAKLLLTEKSWTISEVGVMYRSGAQLSQSARLLIKQLRQAFRGRPTRKHAGSAPTLAQWAFELAE